MVLEPVLCPSCQSIDVGRHGHTGEGKPRYRCYNPDCQRCTFILNYSYQGRLPEVKQRILDMAVKVVVFEIQLVYSRLVHQP
jgi:insertion element IS1 protein InsB